MKMDLIRLFKDLEAQKNVFNIFKDDKDVAADISALIAETEAHIAEMEECFEPYLFSDFDIEDFKLSIPKILAGSECIRIGVEMFKGELDYYFKISCIDDERISYNMFQTSLEELSKLNIELAEYIELNYCFNKIK